MPFSDIDILPVAPQRTDPPDDFDNLADAFVVALQTFSEQLNVFKSELEVAAALIAAAPAYADVALRVIADSGLTPAAGKIIRYTSGAAAALTDLSAFAMTLIDDADAAAARTTLGMSANGQSLVTATDYAAMRDLLSVYTEAEVDAVASATLGLAAPSGAVLAFACDSAPNGWLKCNGAAVSRTTYAALFTAIGTTFGAGNGSTTFNLPDLRGEFVRGWADDGSTDSGRSFGSAQADELEAHTHSNGASFTGTGPIEGYDVAAPDSNNYNVTATGSTGGTETRPRNIALLYCIKT